MKILFTTSDYLLSKLIVSVLDEPVSHCAIMYGDVVVHSTVGGVQVTSLEKFMEHNKIHLVHEIRGGTYSHLIDIYVKNIDVGYDYGALIFLAIRKFASILGIKTGKVNLWQASNLYLCTELVTSAILSRSDAMITPYQLYIKLQKETL